MTGSTIRLRPPAMAADLDAILGLIDYLRPGPWQREVEDALLDWARDSFRELDRERGDRLPYRVGAVAGDVETDSTRTPARRAYESAGFRAARTIIRRGRSATG